MHYKSPFPILKYSGINLEEINDQTLTKAKKILLVELDHASNGSLTIGNEVLTKNDILLLFDSLSGAEQLTYHRWIHENPGLQALLENKALDDHEILFDEKLLHHEKSEDFKAFISPYLAQPLGKVLSQTFTQQHYTKGLKVIKAAQLVVQSDYDVTFGKLQSNIRGITREIKAINERGVEQFKEHQCHFINYYFIQFLNHLPDAFEPLRENFATELISLTVTIQHNHAHLCKRLYFSLSALHCSEEAKEIIKNNLKIFQQVAGDSSTAGNKTSEPQSSGAAILKVGFMVILSFIFILKNCDNKSSTRRSDYKMDFTQPFVHKLTHLKNMQDLKSLSTEQIEYGNPAVSDSVPDSTAWPYASEYKNLAGYSPETGRKISVANQSNYDAILFLSTNWHNYSAFLNAGDSISFHIANKDYLQFYLGKHWEHVSSQNTKTAPTRREHFAEVDSTTLTFLSNIWQSQCSGGRVCSDSSLLLYTDENNTVQFSGNTSASGLKKVDEYFYIKTATDAG